MPEGGNDDTVKVIFEPPVLSLFGNIFLPIGPPSSVVLTTTYVDERVRLGKGSRGSLFVFTRGGPAEDAGMHRVGRETTSKSGVAAFAAFFAALVLGGAGLWSTGMSLQHRRL